MALGKTDCKESVGVGEAGVRSQGLHATARRLRGSQRGTISSLQPWATDQCPVDVSVQMH